MMTREEALNILRAVGHQGVENMTRRMVISRLETLRDLRLTDIDQMMGLSRETRQALLDLVSLRGDEFHLERTGWPTKPKKAKEVVLPAVGDDPILHQDIIDTMGEIQLEREKDPHENPAYVEALRTIASEVIRTAVEYKGGDLDRNNPHDTELLDKSLAYVQLRDLPGAVMMQLGWLQSTEPAKEGQ